MGRPEDLEAYIRFEADGITVYVSRELLSRQKPGTWKLRFHIDGYGKFWLRLEEPWWGVD